MAHDGVRDAAAALAAPPEVAEFIVSKLQAEKIDMREDLAAFAAGGALRPLAYLLLGDSAPPLAAEVLLAAANSASRAMEALLFSTDRAAAKLMAAPPETSRQVAASVVSPRVRAVSDRAVAIVNRQLARLAAEDKVSQPVALAPAGL